MRVRCCLAVLGVLAAAGLDGRAQAPQSPSPGAISGLVVDAVTGQPMPGARVSLARTSGGGSVARAITDSRGRFVFPDLPPAPNYFLDAVTFGYASTRYGWSGPGQSLAISDILLVPVASGQWVQDIRIPLWKYASVSGRVLDERNEPLVGVMVRAYTMKSIAGHPRPVFGGLATTDDQGAYRLTGLHPGEYLVVVPSVQSTVLSTTPEQPSTQPVGALAPSGVSGGRGAFVSAPGIDVDGRHRLAITNFATPPPPSGNRGRAYPSTYYPGVHTAADAQTIKVTYSDTITGIDFAVTPVPAVTVSGQLTGYEDEAPTLLLRLMPTGQEGLGFGAEVATTPVDRDGTFTFLNVPAGDYTLLAQTTVVDLTTASASVRPPDAPGFPSRGAGVGSRNGIPGMSYLSRRGQPSTRWARVPLSVGNQPIDSLSVALQPTVTARGRIVFEQGSRPPDRILFMSVTPANGDPSLGEVDGTVTKAADGFTFELPGLLAARYLVVESIFGRYGVMSIMTGGQNVAYTGLDGSLGRDLDDVVITLTSRRPELKGVVNGPTGPARAAVLVFPEDRARWRDFGWDPAWIGSRGSGADGAFAFDALPEGDYFVIALDAALRHRWTDPAFLAKIAPQATRVSLKWGDAKSIALDLQEVK